jgi:hypothetical protein
MACNNTNTTKKTNEADSLMYIEIEKPDLSNLKPLLMSDFVDSIRYIQLETSPKCFLPQEGGMLTLSGNSIFTAYRDKLYRFDTKGNFICQIGREGKGPGEFALLRSRYTIDETNKKIFVVSRYNESPLVFTFDGAYLGTVRDSTLVSCWGIISKFEAGNNHLIFLPHPADSKSQWICKPYELIIFDYVNMKIVNSLTNRMVADVAEIHNYLPLGTQLLEKQGDRHFYKIFYNDTLYVINNSRITPHAIVDLGKRKFPTDQLYMSAPNKPRPGSIGKILICYMVALPNCYLFHCLILNGTTVNDSFICKYDIATGVTSYHESYIMNDLDGGANVFVRSLSKNIMAVPFPDEAMENKHRLLSEMNKDDLKYPELKEKFEQMQQRRDENDNPLLMTWRLK